MCVCDACTQKGPTDIAEAAVALGGDEESQDGADKDYDELKQSDDINHEVVSSLPFPTLTPAVSVRVYMYIYAIKATSQHPFCPHSALSLSNAYLLDLSLAPSPTSLLPDRKCWRQRQRCWSLGWN